MAQTIQSNEARPDGRANVRRRFSRAFKIRILQELDAARDAGLSAGDILRREGIFSSQVSLWRTLQRKGLLEPQSRGPGRPKVEVRAEYVRKLEAKYRRLQREHEQFKLIMEAQKKLHRS